MRTPLVTILTPVYNGEAFLAECIESVIAQTYQNWEYYIINNCSTDRTLEIAQSFAARDNRIQVTTNTSFVNVAENYNIAFRRVSSRSDYCKAIAADDWLTPDCLSKMVNFALEHPSVGIIGSYQKSGENVKWQELPKSISILSGRDACRLALLKRVQLFGAPSAFLYRSDLVRKNTSFFPNSQPHADTSACYEALRYCDFGIVHEVLAGERVHPGQISSRLETLNAGVVAYLEVFLQYGHRYLDDSELAARRKEIFKDYYRDLGGSVWKLKGMKYWKYHSARLRELGTELEWRLVALSALKEAWVESKNPANAIGKFATAIRDKFRGN